MQSLGTCATNSHRVRFELCSALQILTAHVLWLTSLVRNSCFTFKWVSNFSNNRQKTERGIQKPEGTFKEIEKQLAKILIISGLHSCFLITSHKRLISPLGVSAAILSHTCDIRLPVITVVSFSAHTPPQTFFWQGDFKHKARVNQQPDWSTAERHRNCLVFLGTLVAALCAFYITLCLMTL